MQGQQSPIPEFILSDKNKERAIPLSKKSSSQNHAYICFKFVGDADETVRILDIINSVEEHWKLIDDPAFLITQFTVPIKGNLVPGILRSYRNRPEVQEFIMLCKKVKSHTEPRLLNLFLSLAILNAKQVEEVEYVYIHTYNSPCNGCNKVLQTFVRIFNIPTFVTYNRGYIFCFQP